MERESGVLLHISSLPSTMGIGDLGNNAYKFIDLLEQSGSRIWQILPLGPSGPGNSPYQAYSAFAGNPLFISLEHLIDWGLLTSDEISIIPNRSASTVNFEKVSKQKWPLLKKAWIKFRETADEPFRQEYNAFLNEHGWWLNDYALYTALHNKFKGICWNEWPEVLRLRNAEALNQTAEETYETIEFEKFVQFLFFRQWFRLKEYANSKGIEILGDLPLYVALDSSDVWSNQSIFHLDKEGVPTEVGGVPPDYFSETGQLWGNPVYNWEELAKNNYQWWIARLYFNMHLFDRVRIDHFRGLSAYWSIPAGAPNAISGKWVNAHGKELLSILKQQIGEMPIVAEDLGLITPDVEKLRDDFNLPGMKVLQFAFASDEKNDHLPHNLKNHTIIYTGTHDNNTTKGWLASRTKEEDKNLQIYFGNDKSSYFDQIIDWAWQSAAETAIIPLQDILGLNADARMNTPGIPRGNWRWMANAKHLQSKNFKRLKDLNIKYNRFIGRNEK